MGYDIKQIFQNLARYNERANRKMYEILSALTDRGRKRDTGSWFGSLHGILNHGLIADLNWLKRYRALSPESPVLTDSKLDPPGLSWEHDLCEDFKNLKDMREQVDASLCAWFAEFPVSRYDKIFQYRDSRGNLKTAQAGAAFEFLFLHQTHHRGQIAQILDTLGLPNNLADNAAYLDGAGS
jgi:uncharacterized damage-inducible protein DinB